MKEKRELSKKFWCIILSVSIAFILLIVAGFACFTNSKKPVIEEFENGGNIVLNYTDAVAGLKIKDAVPIKDEEGKKSLEKDHYFDFSIDVSLDNATYIEYELSIVKDEKYSTIPDEDIRFYLEQEDSGSYMEVLKPTKFTPLKEKSKVGTPAGSMLLFKTKKIKSLTDRYRLRMWVSDKSKISKGNYAVEVFVNANTK